MNIVSNGAPKVTPTTKLDAALMLASKGIPVFQLAENSKIPIAGGGVRTATTDETAISRMWRDRPNANIGCASGNGFVWVDCDIRDGKNGLAALAKALKCSDSTLLDSTFAVRTKNGWHLYFTCGQSERFKNAANVLAYMGDKFVGVDVRSEGGYVVGPWSEVGGFVYAPRDAKSSIAAIPSDLSSQLPRAGSRSQDAQEPPLGGWDAPGTAKRARDMLKVRIASHRVAVEGQGGHDETFAVACLVRDLGVSDDTCLQILLEDGGWNDHCEPPWSADELSGVIGNAYRYAQRRAGEKSGNSMDVWLSEFESSAQDVSDIFDNRRKQDQPTRRFLPRSETMQDSSPEPEWLIDQVIQAEAITLLYGPSDSYKSFLVLDMMLSGCALDAWAPGDGHSGFEIKRPLSVLYVAGEGARGIEKYRRPAWREAHAIAKDLPFFTIADMPRMTTTEDVKSLIEGVTAKESPCQKPDIIVFDTVVLAMAGADENSAKDSGMLISACRELIREFGCAIVLIHHTGKDEQKGARGSSNLIASCDSRFRVKVEAGSSRDAPKVLLDCEKQKDSERAPPLRFQGRKVADSLVFDRIAGLKTGLEPADIVRKVLETIPNSDTPSLRIVTQQAAALNLLPKEYSQDAFRKKVERELKGEISRRAYAGLIKPKARGEGAELVGLMEEDETVW